ncbi:conjugal transfer protein [Ruminococcus sp. OA3]|uniref:conjugal transfer protein n=1 Tax=Ruminococcus sp. OA3 TaxID=2914164 RepID=UPI001F050D32|nr:conjugal transfer protein [Ruminococcus sp. OA3]MCH1981195.1 conjugal transfer protein [Ruminococcus sp. OA3]
MCTRFVYNGDDMITGFNFDIDLAVWDHKVITEKERFYIGIRMPDHRYHSFHGVNANGNAGTLLYVHGNEKGQYCGGDQCCSIADLTEAFVRAEISLDDALYIARNRSIVYARDATMQSMLSDRSGRVLIIEPGIGYRLEKERYSLITNYSLLKPEETRPYIVAGDDRYERAKELLEPAGSNFSVADAMSVLNAVRQEGAWATRVSFVYSVREQKVYYVLHHNFDQIVEYRFH